VSKRYPIDFIINDNNCFVCTSHKPSTSGYPQVNYYKTTGNAHRVVYQEMFGSIPSGLVVRHKCDNKMCINPEHLELGTIQDNNNDVDERGLRLRGEQVPVSKLNEQEVKEIKRLFEDKRLALKDLSKMFGVSPSTLCDIKMGRTWKHVTNY
jgi:hypothetical protein